MIRGFLIALFISVSLSSFAADDKFQVSDFTFTKPASWKSMDLPPGGMRKAQLRISDEKSKQTAEVVFFHFGAAQGGDVQANVDRWLGQFQEGKDKINAKVDKATVGALKITWVEAEGTYMSGMPGGAKTAMPNSGLRGAIIESDQGNVFARLTGPKDLVKNSAAEFKKMIESAGAK
jgi:hypothetical protein